MRSVDTPVRALASDPRVDQLLKATDVVQLAETIEEELLKDDID